jgi:hypothetical protein
MGNGTICNEERNKNRSEGKENNKKNDKTTIRGTEININNSINFDVSFRYEKPKKEDANFAEPEDLKQIIDSLVKRVNFLEKENEYYKTFIKKNNLNCILPDFNNAISNDNEIKNNINDNNNENTIKFILPCGNKYSINAEKSTKLSDVFSELKITCLQSYKNTNNIHFLYEGNNITNKFKGKDTVSSLKLSYNKPILIKYFQ